MATLEIKGKDGKKVGSVSLGDKLSKTSAKAHVVHRTVVAEEASARQGTQKTKTRSEVAGGGRKPYKQKKTGRARQGSVRAPHYAHGGMALALQPRDYDKKVNRKERRAAILSALASKIASDDVVVTESIAFAQPKTKDALALLTALGVADAKRVLVVVPEVDTVTYKCFRNLPSVVVRTAPSAGPEAGKTNTFSARDVLVAHKVVIAKEALTRVEEVWAK